MERSKKKINKYNSPIEQEDKHDREADVEKSNNK